MAKTRRRPLQEESEESQARMTFGEHLDELRKRIIRALYGGVIGVGLCVFFMFDIFNIVAQPYHVVAVRHGVPDVLSTLKPQEAFFTFLGLAVKAGLVLTSPWIIYQLWQFIAAGLYKRERRLIYKYIAPSTILFLLGVAFFYFIVLPLTIEFFFSFSAHGGSASSKPTWLQNILFHVTGEPGKKSSPSTSSSNPAASSASAPAAATTSAPATATASAPGPEASAPPANPLNLPALAQDPAPPPPDSVLLYFHTGEQRVKIMLSDKTLIPMVVAQGSLVMNTWRADDYLNFVSFTALIFGVAFELPMVILILAQIDIVQTKTFRSMRRYAYFGILVGAVIVAPSGDLMTLGFLFIPMILLYEVGIIAAAIATRGRPETD